MGAEDPEQEERCPTLAKSYNDLARTLHAPGIDWLSSYSRSAPVDRSETMPAPSDFPWRHSLPQQSSLLLSTVSVPPPNTRLAAANL